MWGMGGDPRRPFPHPAQKAELARASFALGSLAGSGATLLLEFEARRQRREMTLADVAGVRAEPELQAICPFLETQELAHSSVGLRGPDRSSYKVCFA
ncbi:uncharacterized protein LOC143272351 isoform X2 [Peromyscus maniculatus bairdii]|uniref:uncharacterized protein LOC143272351 isoform X2 n=1 Tax=Peromyscus maniculatus bairdii TaxID=230844 RepID=UPI003FD2C257